MTGLEKLKIIWTHIDHFNEDIDVRLDLGMLLNEHLDLIMSSYGLFHIAMPYKSIVIMELSKITSTKDGMVSFERNLFEAYNKYYLIEFKIEEL